MYMESLYNIRKCDYIFNGQKKGKPLSRSQAFRIIKKAANELHMESGISCHSKKDFWVLLPGNVVHHQQY